MVEGFKIKLSPLELCKHLKDRAAYHQSRASEKEAAMPRLRESLETLKKSNVSLPSTHSNMSGKSAYNFDAEDPIDSLEKDIRDHKNKAVVFLFLSDHLFDEEYVLQEADLIRLEILKRW